jgi:ABC-type phosphate/phosphonate transport system substrate-binding protein
MLATLPMYDFPEVREATDAFWDAIAKEYGVSGSLTRDADWTAAWRNPGLLFSQTCGYPFTHEFKGKLKYVATPHYAADGCEGANYCSIIFSWEPKPLIEFKGTIAAFNSYDSMSGMLALQLVFQPFASQGRFFKSSLETGGHVSSLQSLQCHRADVCAVDCVTAAYLKHHRPSALEGLFEIAKSPLVPGLPFVTRSGDKVRLLRALKKIMEDPDLSAVRKALLIKEITDLGADAYDVVANAEAQMKRNGGLLL